MLMDPKDGSLIICDSKNRRIVRWPRRAQQGIILIDNILCTGLAFDKQGFLYVTDHENHRVTRWLLGANSIEDRVVAGGNGKGNKLDQLYEPSAVFVDQNKTVYVADFSNDRIMKWTDGAKEGILLGKIRWPRAIQVDSSGHIYAIDGYHSRVMRWTSENINGTIIIGEQQYTLSQPYDLTFDRHGNAFVVNYGTGRVDKFNIDRSACL
jgi:sugar lactone lactonase YvrE